MVAKEGRTLELNGKNLRKIFFIAAGCIVLYWLLHETERLLALMRGITNILSPFIVGAALAFAINVPMRGIESLLKNVKKQGLRRALALILTLLIVILVIIGVFYLLIPQLIDTVESIVKQLPDFVARVRSSVMGYMDNNPHILQWLTEYTDYESINWSEVVQSGLDLITASLGGIMTKTVTFVVSLGTGIFNGILSVAFALYCLVRKEILARQARRLLYCILPEKVTDEIIRIARMTNVTFSKFLSGQCLEAVILGAMFAVAMSIFRMPYVALVSVIIGITALVPIVGAFVGCIIGGFFILVVNPVMAFWFVVMFLILQQIEGNLIYPRVVGSSVGLPGMWVLVAVAVGGDLMGVGGMLLMIPLASVLYALAREFTSMRLEKLNIPRDKLMEQPIVISWQKINRKKKENKQEKTTEETKE